MIFRKLIDNQTYFLIKWSEMQKFRANLEQFLQV